VNKVAKTGVAAFCLWGLVLSAHALERIGAFHSDIRVAASGELSVTETIEVQAGGREPQRGLVRDFPRARAPLSIDKVLRNGRPEPYALERGPANGVRLSTGESGRALTRGKQVYQIVYRTSRRIGYFDEHDELVWDVAAGLALALERLSVEVSFERPVAPERMKLDAWTGTERARGHDYHGFVREGSAAFRATRPLAPREGMTILVAFPKGVVAEPPLHERGATYLSAHPGVPVGAGFLAAMLVMLIACWRRFGRRETSTRSTPPDGVGAGGVRFIDRRRYDERCLSAALLGLESRGYLRIREQGERLRIERTGNDIEWLPGEETLARRLLRDERADIRRHGRTLDEAGRALSKELSRAFGRRAWAPSGSFVLAAAGLGGVGVLAMLALEAPLPAIAVLAAAKAAALLVFATKLIPVYRARGASHRPDIEALRNYLASGQPKSEEEFAELLPYAVALELENVWGKRYAQKLPGILLEFTPRAQDRAPARPRRPLRHTRSAAA
jgi:Predicted membrane protein (DUF2207)